MGGEWPRICQECSDDVPIRDLLVDVERATCEHCQRTPGAY